MTAGAGLFDPLAALAPSGAEAAGQLGAPPAVLVAAGLAAVATIALGFALMRRRRGAADRGLADDRLAAPVKDAGARILLLGSAGDLLVSQAASVLKATYGACAEVATAGAEPLANLTHAEQTARALGAAKKARAALVLWALPDGEAVRWRILAAAPADGPPQTEGYRAPADLDAPVDSALAALVAAVGLGARELAEIAAPLARLEERLLTAPGGAAAPLERVFVEAASARSALARAARENADARLERAYERAAAILETPAHAAEEGEPAPTLLIGAETLERAEAHALAAGALDAAAARAAESAVRTVTSRVEHWRAARAIWALCGASDRLAGSAPCYARAVLEAFDRTRGPAWIEDAERAACEALASLQAGRARTMLLAARGGLRSRLAERAPRSGPVAAAEDDLRAALDLAEPGADRRWIGLELADAVARRSARERGLEGFERAIACYQSCLDGPAPAGAFERRTAAQARLGLGRALHQLGERKGDRAAVGEAVTLLRLASQELDAAGAPAAAALARRSLERAERFHTELRPARVQVD